MTDIHFEGEGSVTVDSDVLSRAITTINLSNADAVFMLGDYVQKDARHATALLHNYLQKLTLTVSSQTNTSDDGFKNGSTASSAIMMTQLRSGIA